MRFEDAQHIHLIGIGGYGISAVARILLERGYSISGSDRNSNALTQALADDGATVYQGHAAEYVNGADMVIISSAIPADHIEINAAEAQGIPVYKRRDILVPLMAGNTVIAVAGTHGKTTTTSMIVHILRECGKDPSYIVGGVMANTNTNAGVGTEDIFVIEADEYDNMFLGLLPDIAIVTSVEYDHPDFFKTWVEMRESFREFIDLLPDDGVLIGCGDDATTEMLIKQQNQLSHQRIGEGLPARKVISYGVEFLDFVDVLGWHQRIDSEGFNVFDVEIEDKLFGTLGTVRLSLPGKHNMQNALAAIAATNQLRVSVGEATKALTTFRTTGRRFEIRGTVKGVTVIDDYAHHPTAIKSILEATRSRFPGQEIWAVWQPHMFSRTQHLIEDYSTAFTMADHVLVTDIFAAREDPIEGIDGAMAASSLRHPEARHISDFDAMVSLLVQEVAEPAVIVIMSAGDAPRIGEKYLERIGGT